MRPLGILLLSCAALFAQPAARIVRANGTGSVTVTPDQVKINFGVSTTAVAAQDAAAQNATASTTMQGALRKVLGNAGDLATVSYTISPNYVYQTGQPAKLTGYTVTNTVEVTSTSTALAGPLIDAASQAGATTIGALRFSLKDDSIPRAQALSAAAQQARSHAMAIAAGLNARVGNVVTAQEGMVTTPIVMRDAPTTLAGAATPIDTGTTTVTATVTVDFELN